MFIKRTICKYHLKILSDPETRKQEREQRQREEDEAKLKQRMVSSIILKKLININEEKHHNSYFKQIMNEWL